MSNKTDPFDLSAGVPGVNGDLRPGPKVAERISKRVLFVVFGLIVVVVGVFLAALDSMDKPARVVIEEDSTKAIAAGAPTDLLTDGKQQLPEEFALPPTPISSPEKSAVVLDVPKLQEVEKLPPPLTPEQQRAILEAEDRYRRMMQAKNDGLKSKAFGVSRVADGAGGAGSEADVLAQLMKTVAKDSNGAAAAAGQPQGQVEMGDQERKLDFLSNNAKQTNDYHPHFSKPALSRNEIKTGSFIPMVLEQSINSDLPGQITARVTEDVYDSITGCRMLIPAMSKVVGRYDSRVAIGQGRMLIAWNSLIFRDGAELNLAGLQGYDTSGQAGLESDVDNHYWRLFGLTFGLSMITAGVQLSVPQPNQGANGATAPQSPSQIIAASLAQQYGTLGAQIIGRYMAVQPTLRNFAGERFIVMVPRTIIFNKVWRDRCPGGGA